MPIVAKPFNTVNRRFRPGTEVAETEDLSPHSFAALKAGGFIAAGEAAEPKPQPDKAEASRSRFRK